MTREELKNEIKRRIPCTEYLTKAPKGRYICPFCGSGSHGGGSDGALNYYSEDNTVHCFSCGKTADVIDLYRESTGTDYNTALDDLSRAAGITGTAPTKKTANKREKQEKPPQDFKAYYKTCIERLDDSAQALSYLADRGIKKATADRFYIGFDPEADPAKAPGGNGEKLHPTPRIIIPCTKSYYIARSIDPNTPAQYKAPNPAGSHTHIFNGQSLTAAEVIFVCEGVFDALSIIEQGYNSIALNGKGNHRLLMESIERQGIKPGSVRFVVIPDNDTDPQTNEQTQRQAAELTQKLNAKGFISLVADIAQGEHDINDLHIKDPDELKKRLDLYETEIKGMTIQYVENTGETGQTEYTPVDPVKALDDFESIIQTEAYKPIKTGLSFFDNLLGGGMLKQTLLILMAAPGAGKTALASQIGESLAANGQPVYYLNFEMSQEQMIARSISAHLAIKDKIYSAADILQGYRWTDQQKKDILEEIALYKQRIATNMIYDTGATGADLASIDKLLNRIGEQAKQENKPAPVVVVDYLHLISAGERLDNAETLKKTVETLKNYARDNKTLVIAISATNRESAKPTGTVTMQSARDSSNIEYSADYLLSLSFWKKDIDTKEERTAAKQINEELQQEARQMAITVLKARLCAPGKTTPVYFIPKVSRFYGMTDTTPKTIEKKPFNGAEEEQPPFLTDEEQAALEQAEQAAKG